MVAIKIFAITLLVLVLLGLIAAILLCGAAILAISEYESQDRDSEKESENV